MVKAQNKCAYFSNYKNLDQFALADEGKSLNLRKPASSIASYCGRREKDVQN